VKFKRQTVKRAACTGKPGARVLFAGSIGRACYGEKATGEITGCIDFFNRKNICMDSGGAEDIKDDQCPIECRFNFSGTGEC